MLPVTTDLINIWGYVHLNNELKERLYPLLILAGVPSQNEEEQQVQGHVTVDKSLTSSRREELELQEVDDLMPGGHIKIFLRKMKRWSQESFEPTGW